jgi:16S rRNA processing protein RimM
LPASLDPPPTHLLVARILTPWGLKGDIRIQVVTDFPDRFRRNLSVWLGPDRIPARIERARPYKEGILLKLRGHNTPEHVSQFAGMDVFVAAEDAVELPEGDYFYHQIIGLAVQTEDGAVIGQVEEIIATGSNDVYIVKGENGEIPIPALDTVILDIDLARGILVVRLPEGLI